MTSDRPEHVTCIRATTIIARCGRDIARTFAFKSPAHAVASTRSGSRLVTCPACAKTAGVGALIVRQRRQ